MDPQQQRFEYGRQIQFQHRQLDSHDYYERARWPIQSHGSLDGQPNDRLGRPLLQWGLSGVEHRREILCATRCYADADAYTYSYAHRHRNCNRYSDCYANTHSYSYSQGNAHCPAKRNTKDTAYPTAAVSYHAKEQRVHFSSLLSF